MCSELLLSVCYVFFASDENYDVSKYSRVEHRYLKLLTSFHLQDCIAELNI